MSQGFLIWTDFHPILVGAGCLALGYVYGRHCRSVSEIPADVPPASDDVCCAQSQSNTYFEDLEHPCKCCVSAPADLDAMAVGKASKFTRSPYLVQDAAEGFEQAERSTKRDLAHRMERLEYPDGEDHGMRQHFSRPYLEKGYQMLEEERLLQAKTPYKKQKGSLSCKGKGEMGFDPLSSGKEDAAAPWSREVLHRRIEYFNNVSDATAESGRSDESRKLRLIKKKFLKVCATGEEPAYDSTNTTSNNLGGVVRSGSTTGLVQLATLDQADDDINNNSSNNNNDNDNDNSPSSPYRLSGGGCNMAVVVETSVLQSKCEAPEFTFSFGNSSNGPDGLSKETDRDARTFHQGNALEATTEAVFLSAAPEHHETCEWRELPGDEMVKTEIYELLNETDCTKVSFEEIVSLLEKRLQTNLQERKAHISDLVDEVVGISKLLEKEVETEQKKVHSDLSSYASSSKQDLGKLRFSYDYCP